MKVRTHRLISKKIAMQQSLQRKAMLADAAIANASNCPACSRRWLIVALLLFNIFSKWHHCSLCQEQPKYHSRCVIMLSLSHVFGGLLAQSLFHSFVCASLLA